MAGNKFRRGDLVTGMIAGSYGKPRPMLIIQSDAFDQTASVVLMPVTSAVGPMPLFRITVEPSDDNGLEVVSQIMVDKISTVPREKIGQRIGRIDESTLFNVERALAVFLGIA